MTDTTDMIPTLRDLANTLATQDRTTAPLYEGTRVQLFDALVTHADALTQVSGTKISADADAAVHLVCIAHDAGLAAMVGLLEILRERGTLTNEAARALAPEDIERMYEAIVGPAVDSLERDLREIPGR